MKRWLTLTSIIVLAGFSSFLLDACKKSDVRRVPGTVNFVSPPGFPQPVHDFTANPLTEEGIALGQKLFYEDRLSAADFSCASCHQQIGAFTTYEHDRSHGYNHSHTLRNAPALSNLAWQAAFRQDGSMTNLESLSLAHITAPDEMAENMDNVVAKLQQDTRYKQLFKAAYGDETINSERVLKALSQFLLSMVSANSKYDRVKKGEASFGVYEEMGYAVFKAKCASCHSEPLFTDFSYRNIGLPVNPSLLDYGRMRVTGNKTDSLKFRVPSLRNLEFSSYYFHDGRYSNMQRAIEHYRNDIQQSSTLDPALTNGISLTDTDVINLMAFLKTLSDSSYIQNPKFAKPTF